MRAAQTPGIPQACITNALSKRYNLKEVEVPTYMQNAEAKPIQHGGLECYIEFDSLEAALAMPGHIEVEGVLVRLHHKGRYLCKRSGCGLRGHTEPFHDKAMKILARNEKRHAKRQKRKSNPN